MSNSLSRTALLSFWILFLASGGAILYRYQNSGGSIGNTPDHWPEQASIALDPARPTFVMFAHPRCPCTRASVEQLNRVLARTGGDVAAHLFFFRPTQPELPSDWVQTDLWRSARQIPGVTVHEDPDGVEARRFGAETSGYALLFDPQGRLQFRGGITAGRGHAGDNAGASAVVALAAGREPASTGTPVYGCSLVGDTCDGSEQP